MREADPVSGTDCPVRNSSHVIMCKQWASQGKGGTGCRASPNGSDGSGSMGLSTFSPPSKQGEKKDSGVL